MKTINEIKKDLEYFSNKKRMSLESQFEVKCCKGVINRVEQFLINPSKKEMKEIKRIIRTYGFERGVCLNYKLKIKSILKSLLELAEIKNIWGI